MSVKKRSVSVNVSTTSLQTCHCYKTIDFCFLTFRWFVSIIINILINCRASPFVTNVFDGWIQRLIRSWKFIYNQPIVSLKSISWNVFQSNQSTCTKKHAFQTASLNICSKKTLVSIKRFSEDKINQRYLGQWKMFSMVFKITLRSWVFSDLYIYSTNMLIQ